MAGVYNATKVESYHDKHFTTVVYEYRGSKYEVTYANGWNVCCTPAWVQHRDEQAKIDDIIDNPKVETIPAKPAWEALDEWFEMLERG